jgi:hypothetical protein
MLYYTSTLYASVTLSVSTPWTLILLFEMKFILPSILKLDYHTRQLNEGPGTALPWVWGFLNR